MFRQIHFSSYTQTIADTITKGLYVHKKISIYVLIDKNIEKVSRCDWNKRGFYSHLIYLLTRVFPDLFHIWKFQIRRQRADSFKKVLP